MVKPRFKASLPCNTFKGEADEFGSGAAPSGMNAFAVMVLQATSIIITGHGSCTSRQLAI